MTRRWFGVLVALLVLGGASRGSAAPVAGTHAILAFDAAIGAVATLRGTATFDAAVLGAGFGFSASTDPAAPPPTVPGLLSFEALLTLAGDGVARPYTLDRLGSDLAFLRGVFGGLVVVAAGAGPTPLGTVALGGDADVVTLVFSGLGELAGRTVPPTLVFGCDAAGACPIVATVSLAVPAPGGLMLLGLGIAALGAARRRRAA